MKTYTSPQFFLCASALFFACGLSRAQMTVPLQGASKVTTGYQHSCALTQKGAVVCWGLDTHGELGNAGNVDSAFPVGTAALYGGATDVSAGISHTCAVNSGKIVCWGFNADGQLGNNSSSSSSVPVQVSGISAGATKVAAGGNHSCALVGGGVKCWGANDSGQLGNNSVDPSAVPVDVSGLGAGVSAIAVGLNHSCAIVSGAVVCWGDGTYGQLGNGSLNSQSSIPVPVQGLGSGITAIAAGGLETCAIAGGAVLCWGDGVSGQLGDGSSGSGDYSAAPVTVTGLSGVLEISVGLRHVCATTINSTLCWGDNNGGKLGNGSADNSSTAIAVSGISASTSPAAGGNHSCTVVVDQVRCWGGDEDGQLGDGSSETSILPVTVGGLDNSVFAIATADEHTCAASNSGVSCWGLNLYDELSADPDVVFYSYQPVGPVASSAGVSALGAGGDHSCMVVGGGISCWGINSNGQLGNNSISDSWPPVPVSGISTGMAVVAGGEQSCAIVSGGVQCWGYNGDGELGNSSTAESHVPVPVTNLSSGVSALALGRYHGCALVSGGAQCWGDNLDGALGDVTLADDHSTSPRQVTGLTSGVTSISAGLYHSCAVVNGGAYCWGSNLSGELGNGGASSSTAPVAVSGLASGVVAVASGEEFSCAIAQGGSVQCWGYNDAGQLGDRTFTNRNTPVRVAALGGQAVAIAAGGSHACAILTTGAVRCWGDNFYGETGGYRAIYSLVPVIVQQTDVIFADGMGEL